MDFLDVINPKFRRWHGKQDVATQAKITAKWQALATDPSIAHGWPSAGYARRTMLLQWCVQNLGYAP